MRAITEEEARPDGSPRRATEEPFAVPQVRPLRLADVYRDHASFVWRFGRRHGLSSEAASDLVQEVFVVLHRRLSEYDGRASLCAWIHVIARGVLANTRRSVSRATKRLLLVPVTEGPGDPEIEVERRRAVARVEAFLAKLEPDKREVFALCDIEGLSAPEAAAALGVKLNTVYSRLRAARLAFRAHLGAPKPEVQRMQPEGAKR